jgi:hypothetical protein
MRGFRIKHLFVGPSKLEVRFFSLLRYPKFAGTKDDQHVPL